MLFKVLHALDEDYHEGEYIGTLEECRAYQSRQAVSGMFRIRETTARHLSAERVADLVARGIIKEPL